MSSYTVPATKALERNRLTQPQRLVWVDHLRAAVVILVVVHHVAMTYAGYSFPYTGPVLPKDLDYVLLILLMTFNQAWFMGLLFLVAGYFTPLAYDRRGPASYLKGRLVRLAIPLAVSVFLIQPPIVLFADRRSTTAMGQPTQYFDDGVLWFLTMLLIFSFGYMIWRMLTAGRLKVPAWIPRSPGLPHICVFVLALTVLTYLFRIFVPIGGPALGFPSLYYLPQYAVFFVLGTLAYRLHWLRALSDRAGLAALVTALVATLALFAPIWSAFRFVGGGTLHSAIYALWESTFALGIGLGLVVLFRRFLDRSTLFGRFLAKNSYAVYVVHFYVIGVVAALLRGIRIATLASFCIASIIAVLVSFAVAHLLRRIPGVSRVL